jgi:xanthine dehydrogenase accessory factor
MRREVLSAILDARKAKRPVAVVTLIGPGRQALISADGSLLAGDHGVLGDDVSAVVEAALAEDRSHNLETAGGLVFVQALNPPLRMAIVGAVHITQALAPMAALLGYEVTVIDPRRAFASGERFPAVRVLGEWPDEALKGLRLDHRTAVVTLTHDPKLDDPALAVALDSEAFYIASLGSRRTHAARIERLRQAGFRDEAIARIHGPAGLAINARSPAEIATAILAQATQALRGGAAA